jgi:hypothetical protein
MTGMREKSEDISMKLWQVDVQHSQGKSVLEAAHQIGVKVQFWLQISSIARSSLLWILRKPGLFGAVKGQVHRS